MAVIRTRLNLYNNATNCYEVTGGVGKKTRSAKIFWFSLLLGYFLMSYRRSCLIVRRLGLLMARYRALYRKYRTIQLSGSLHKKIAYKRNSSNNIFVKSAPKLLRSNFGIRTSVFSSVSNKSIRKLRHAKTKYKYRYHAKTGRRIAFPTRDRKSVV